MMARIQHEVPEDLHLKVKRLQLEMEEQGKKLNLKDLYVEVIRAGLEAIAAKKS